MNGHTLDWTTLAVLGAAMALVGILSLLFAMLALRRAEAIRSAGIDRPGGRGELPDGRDVATGQRCG